MFTPPVKTRVELAHPWIRKGAGVERHRLDVGSSSFRCRGDALWPPDRQDLLGERLKTPLGAYRPGIILASAAKLQTIERTPAIARLGARGQSAGHSLVRRRGRSSLLEARFTARVELLEMRLQAGEKIPDVAVELREITDCVQHLLESSLI